MNARLTVLSLDNPRSKHLAARCIARNPKITMNHALFLLDHLPAVIFTALPWEEASEMAQAMEKLGCKIKLEELFPQKQEETANEKSGDEAKPFASAMRAEKKFSASARDRPVPFKQAFQFPFIAGGASIASTRNQGQKRKLSWAVWVVLILFGALFALLVQKAMHMDKKGGARSHITEKKVRELEASLLRSPGDAALQEKAIDAYKSISKEASTARQLDYLSRAMRMKPEDQGVRRLYSRACADSAKRLMNSETRIQFFKMAVSINGYNEEAWNGLITAYEESNKQAEAQEARKKKHEVFAERYRDITELMERYGRILSPPEAHQNMLILRYQSLRAGREEILAEVFDLGKNLQRIADHALLTITIRDARGQILRISSLLENAPENYQEWKKESAVEQIKNE